MLYSVLASNEPTHQAAGAAYIDTSIHLCRGLQSVEVDLGMCQ